MDKSFSTGDCRILCIFFMKYLHSIGRTLSFFDPGRISPAPYMMGEVENMTGGNIPFLCENSRLTASGKLVLLCACLPGGLSPDDACRILHLERDQLLDLPSRYFAVASDGRGMTVREKAVSPVLRTLAMLVEVDDDSLCLALSAAFHRNDGEALRHLCRTAARAFSSGLALIEKKAVASALIFVLTRRRMSLRDIAGCGRFVSFMISVSPHLLSYGGLREFSTLLFKAKGMAFAIGNDKAYSFLHFAIQCVSLPLSYAQGKNFDVHLVEESFWQLRNFHDSSLRLISLSFLSEFYIFTGKYFNVINIWRLNTLLDAENTPRDCAIIENAFIGAMMTCQYALARDIAASAGSPSSLPLREIAGLYCSGWKEKVPLERLKSYSPSPLLSLAYFLSGETRLAAETLGPVSAEHFLRYPFLPELLFQLEQKGLPVFSDREWAEAVRRARNASNTILRAIFLRMSAGRLLSSSDRDDEEILSCLRHSLNILQGSLAPLESARTCLALSRFLTMTGRSSEAEAFEKKAAEISAAFFPALWPEDRPMPELSASSATSPYFPYFLIFQSLLELNCRQLVKSAPLFFNGILSAFMTAFGALQGGVVQEKEKKRECVAATEGWECGDVCGNPMPESDSSLVVALPDASEDMARIVLRITQDEKESFFLSAFGHFRKAIFQILDRSMCELLTSQILSEIGSYQRTQQTHSHSLLRSPVYMASPGDGAIFFRSPEMKKLVKTIDLLAPTEASVLLIGESGVGKERLARRIHDQSGRSGEFIPVNLSSIPASLFESECLGYEKGSFTGAAGPKKGLFELADNGTLFLDEIADVPMDVQVKLLRILQERAFRRVGGLKQIHSRFRIIAATNANLEKAVADGKLRSDLYFRLNTISLFVPPLRERRGDILFLAEIFLGQYCQQYGKKRRVLSDEEKERLLSMPWPGNVRELMHFMERLAILEDFQRAAATGAVHAGDFPSVGSEKRASASGAHAGLTEGDFFWNGEIVPLSEMEAKYFAFVYRQKKGRVTGKNGIAQALGISDHTAFNWIRRLNLGR